jgi:aspartate aminotransferase
VITEYQDRRNTLVAALKAIPGVQVGEPKGAFYCIVQLPIKNSDAFAQWLLEEFDDQGETVMVAPAAGFYSSPGVGLNQVRIAYVLKKESLVRAVEILKLALEKYKD